MSILNITKGNNSAKSVGGVTVVNLCTSSGHVLYFYQVLLNYLERYQSYRADTISILKITKGNNSAKNVDGVNVVNLCTSSSHFFFFFFFFFFGRLLLPYIDPIFFYISCIFFFFFF